MKKSSQMKKILSSILISTCIVLPSGVSAVEVNNEAISKIGSKVTLAKEESKSKVKVYFNGKQIEFDQEPIIVNGRTKVPFRAIFEEMGTVVYYRDDDKSVLGLTRDGDVIKHTVGTNKATINGVEKTYDSISEIKNDRTLIPVRMVSDLLSASVEWKDKEKEVQIEKKIETSGHNKLVMKILECTLNQNFNPEDFKRYIEYQYKNPGLTPEQVVLNVNMDLDKELVKVYTKEEEIRKFTINIRYVNELLGKYHYEAKEEDIETVRDIDSPTVLINHFNKLPEYYANYKVDNFTQANPKEWIDTCLNAGGMMYDVYLRDYVVNDYISFVTAYTNYLRDKTYNEEEKRNHTWFAHTPFTGFSDGNSIERTTVRQVMHEYGRFDKEAEEEYYAYNYASPRYTNDLNTGLAISYKNFSAIKQYINDELFSNVQLYDWVKDNAHKYGFVVRYPSGKEHITRKPYQPWHLRYVGKDAAQIMYNENLCLEEYCAKYENKSGYTTDLESTKTKVLKLN